MELEFFSHRHAEDLLNSVPAYIDIWQALEKSLRGISDEDLIKNFEDNFQGKTKQTMSLSKSINLLITEALDAKTPKQIKKHKLNEDDVWVAESEIFHDSASGLGKWRLDFAKTVFEKDASGLRIVSEPKKGISIEVAFNNAGSAAWNLLKPSIASELNHVDKRIQSSIAILIVATEELKVAGAFDKTVGTFESYRDMLVPLREIIKVPMLIVGLKAPKTFKVVTEKVNGKNYGKIERL
jgi:hypothetical protein